MGGAKQNIPKNEIADSENPSFDKFQATFVNLNTSCFSLLWTNVGEGSIIRTKPQKGNHQLDKPNCRHIFQVPIRNFLILALGWSLQGEG